VLIIRGLKQGMQAMHLYDYYQSNVIFQPNIYIGAHMSTGVKVTVSKVHRSSLH